MGKSIFYSLSLIIGLILFYFALKEIGFVNINSALAKISLGQFLFVSAFIFLGFLIGTLRWLVIARSQISRSISFLDVFVTRTIGFAISYLTPVVFLGGQPFKALVLKERTKASIEKIVVSIILEEAIFLSFLFLFIVFGAAFLILRFTLPSSLKSIIIAITFFCLFIFCFFYYRLLKKSAKEKGFFGFFIELLRLDKIDFISKIKKRVDRVEQKISDFFKHQKSELIIASFFTVVELFFSIIGYKMIIGFLGGNLNLMEVISINSLINLIYFLPIPAALGTFEWSQALIFNIFGLTLDLGVAFSLLVRVISLIIVGLGIIFLLHFEMKILIKKIETVAQKIGDSLNLNDLLK